MPLIAPGPSPSSAPMAPAVIGLSPVIMRTSMPALSAIATASFASARSGSIMPAMPDEGEVLGHRHRVGLVIASTSSSAIEAGREREHAQPLLAHARVGGVELARARPRSAPASR